MQTEFRKAILPREVRSLTTFDGKVFNESDRFLSAYWRELESYWLIVNRVKVGCCAFERHVDFQEDVRPDHNNVPMTGSLFIVSTGILPRFQGQGWGRLMKSWQICFARRNGFHRIVTNVRSRNKAIIDLNKSFGFRRLRKSPGYYHGPSDATVVMELMLSTHSGPYSSSK